MSLVVLDACAAVALVLGELTALPATERAIRSLTDRRVIVPAVYWFEARHALLRPVPAGSRRSEPARHMATGCV